MTGQGLFTAMDKNYFHSLSVVHIYKDGEYHYNSIKENNNGVGIQKS